MRPEKSLVICTLPRSGSYLLSDALGQTGELGYPAEYYNPDNQNYYDELIGNKQARNYDIVFDYIMRIGTTNNGIFGTKILYHQLSHLKAAFTRTGSYESLAPIEILNILLPDPHYIYLVRNDKLRQAISYHRAISSGIWWRFEATKTKSERIRPQYDYSAIRQWLTTMEEWEATWPKLLSRLQRPVLPLNYDGIVADLDGTVAQIYEFAGVVQNSRSGRKHSELKRQSDSTTEDWVRRFLSDDAAKSQYLA